MNRSERLQEKKRRKRSKERTVSRRSRKAKRGKCLKEEKYIHMKSMSSLSTTEKERELLIRDISIREAITISPNSTVLNAAKKMRDYRVGSLVVISNQKLHGILTKGDILFRVVAEELDHNKVRVAQIATRDVITVSRNTPIREALNLALETRVRQLIVVENEKPVGIVSEKDLIKALTETERKLPR